MKHDAAFKLTLTLLISLLGACTTFSEDGGFGAVQKVAREKLDKDLVWIRSDPQRDEVAARVGELLARPLTVDDAVQVALLNNRALQANLQELGIAEARVVQAARLPNPLFSMLRADRLEAGVREYKIEQAVSFDLFSLLTMPKVVAIENRRFERTQHEVTMAALRIASDTRKAYYGALAAQESLRYWQQVLRAADAGALLAHRMAQVGNFSKLQQAREQAFYAEAALGVARAQQTQVATREALVRMLGLWSAQTMLTLPERLPALPRAPTDLPAVEQMAIAQRLDLQAMKLETQALASNLGLTRVTRLVNVFELGPARVLEGPRDDPYKKGLELNFSLPLFDWGEARTVGAQARYRQQLDRAAQSAIEARSEVREAYHAYRTAFDIARHYRDEIVPLRKRIGEENLLRYNGMLIGVFDLLADARAQIVAVNASIDALRDFWLGQADLEMALIGKPSPSAPTSSPGSALSTGAAH